MAENCAVPIACSETLAGVTVTCPELAVTVTVVDAVCPPLVAVAFTVQEPVLAGAVYSPLLAPTVPHVAVHVEGALAVNCRVPFTATDGFIGEIVRVVDEPVPESATVCGLFVAESVKLRVAVRVPAAVGLNTIEAVQLADAPRLVEQVLLEIAKSPAFVPVIATLLIVIDELNPFFNVAVCAAVVDPTAVLAKPIDVGLAATPPGAYPVNVTTCGLFVAESLKFSVAARFPVVVGANTTFAVQLADAARLVPHVFE